MWLRAEFFDDRDGEELVNNLPGYVVALRRQNSPYDAEILNLLSEIIEMPVAEMQKKIEANSDSYEPTRLKKQILLRKCLPNWKKKMNELPGVMIEIQPVRNYLYKELAVHAIGYVGEVSNYDITEGSYKNMPVGSVVGKFGLEKTYDRYVRGQDGSYDEEVDVGGNVVKQLGQIDPVPGKSLKLTIDKDLQLCMEKAVDEHLAYLRSSGVAPGAGQRQLLLSTLKQALCVPW